MNQIIRLLHNSLIAICLSLALCASATFGQAPADAINVWQPHRSFDQPSSPVQPPGDSLSEIEQVVFDAPPVAGSEIYHLPNTVLPPSAMPATSVQPVVMPAEDICYLGDPYPNAFVNNEPWHFQLLPDGVIWSSYMAGVRESRTSGVVYGDQGGATLLDVSLGGRMAIFRNGTRGPSAKTGRPEGLEFQIEGAAMPRLNLDENWDLESVDFRFGMPIILARENWQWKFSYYHLSAHLGDELAIREAALGQRINYSRDVFVLGLSYYTSPAWRWYGEGGWAFYTDGGSDPWEFQFGVDISEPGPTGPSGTPFVALNGHLREEVDFGGNFVGQAGWLWRGDTGRTVRAGVHYHNGKSSQFEFFDQFEEQIGGGIWADF
ncbi:DUF1207 domain-containing protein [Adhaeretor mobilis]|uniref:DUF1207 domain-containing protein n=1 Tax=Adhaeretor mobilis TaxID=1930276 RepID=A0A517MT42_9BACT|nr:DUF1207 domain-containing protein [Adhaeretor mobilis]QDS97967.1 hypothetical protein HG15A2_12370 [Adhaeretor mobilis]